MSLGFRSLWRAQSYTIGVKELSLIPREQHNPFLIRPPQRPSSRRSISTPSKNTKSPQTLATILRGRSPSSFTRALRRRVIKQISSFQPKQAVLVKPPVKYPDKYKSLRSLRRHRRSAAKQHLYDAIHEGVSDPPGDWRLTLNFMLRHTRNVGEILHFRIVIGRGIATETYKALSEPDTSLYQISSRNESVISIEEFSPENGELVLKLSGSEDSVRKSLVDVVGLMGKITAVRVPDSSWEPLLLDAWRGASKKQPGIQLIANSQVAVDDRTVTVQASVSHSAEYRHYMLTRRANEIERPAEWTKVSFEKYVAELVRGQVPSHLARSLYADGPNHQETVVSLLLDLFTSEETRSAASVSALKLAVNFIESRGGGFRQASRSIFNQVDALRLPMDAEIFNIFLASASKARDLNGFDSILKMMVRKGLALQGGAWVAFLAMVEDPSVKSYIAAKLRVKKLNRNPSARHAIGRQIALLDLERHLSSELDIREFISSQKRKYGAGWLDTMTLHRIFDILGAHGHLDACNALWDLVCTERIASPDAVLLNTMLTHTRKISQKVTTVQSILGRSRETMPWLQPDHVTYHLLFRVAWTKRYPNMMRVVLRYSAFAKLIDPKMRYSLTTLLRPDRLSGTRRVFLKSWEDVIFGRVELEEMRARYADRLNVNHLVSRYQEQANGMTPSVPFETKLEEAFTMDVKIHRLLKEETIMSTSMRESLSVDIPLEPEAKQLKKRENAFRAITSLVPAIGDCTMHGIKTSTYVN
ncbi:hypothetical protein GGR53DRAFT_412965 [Hypoxylon sp. FL1150]|nr:hypothetical protein GGR53DRAFT_412965 [Hypoxylon sp. FL1150]